MNGRGCVPIKLCLQTKFCKYIKINRLSTPAPSMPHLAASMSQTQTGPCHSSPEVVHQPRLDQFKLAVWFTGLQSKRGPWEQHHHHLEACLRNAESQAPPRPAESEPVFQQDSQGIRSAHSSLEKLWLQDPWCPGTFLPTSPSTSLATETSSYLPTPTFQPN